MSKAGLQAAEDAQVAAVARGQGRAVVTENVVDFAPERDVVLVFVLKRNLPAGGGQAAALAKALGRWAQDHPDPPAGGPDRIPLPALAPALLGGSARPQHRDQVREGR